jgi:hypothetical protein
VTRVRETLRDDGLGYGAESTSMKLGTCSASTGASVCAGSALQVDPIVTPHDVNRHGPRRVCPHYAGMLLQAHLQRKMRHLCWLRLQVV